MLYILLKGTYFAALTFVKLFRLLFSHKTNVGFFLSVSRQVIQKNI